MKHKHTERYSVNKQKYTTTNSEKDWKGLISIKRDRESPFFKTTPLFYQPVLFLCKKFESPFFGGTVLKTQTPPL